MQDKANLLDEVVEQDRQLDDMRKYLNNLLLRMTLAGQTELRQDDLDAINKLIGNYGLTKLDVKYATTIQACKLVNSKEVS